ncbi:MAG: hypothetical protein ACKPKO_32885, partial [Candidatus Fonsibacter sp.]
LAGATTCVKCGLLIPVLVELQLPRSRNTFAFSSTKASNWHNGTLHDVRGDHPPLPLTCTKHCLRCLFVRLCELMLLPAPLL